jgi:hypothetical protein
MSICSFDNSLYLKSHFNTRGKARGRKATENRRFCRTDPFRFRGRAKRFSLSCWKIGLQEKMAKISRKEAQDNACAPALGL